MRIADIRVGTRFRKEMGDIASLAKSIQEVGLLHPVVVTPDGELIAGMRRLAACQSLGWTDIPVTVLAIENITLGEHDENVMRLDFTLSEKYAIGAALKERVVEEAARRSLANLRGRAAESAGPPMGDTRDLVGKAIGVAGSTWDELEEVMETAQEHPELAPVVEEMDRTGKIAPALRIARSVTGKPQRREGGVAQRTEGRHNLIRQMGREGYRKEEIARAVGVSASTVWSVLNAAGIESADSKVGRHRGVKADQIMESIINGAIIPAPLLATLFGSWGELNRSRFPEWDQALTECMSSMNRIRSKIRGDNGH